jgi:hypothetical protein
MAQSKGNQGDPGAGARLASSVHGEDGMSYEKIEEILFERSEDASKNKFKEKIHHPLAFSA